MIRHRIAMIRNRITNCCLYATDRETDEPQTSMDDTDNQEKLRWIDRHRSIS
jgi:hypothetical protein